MYRQQFVISKNANPFLDFKSVQLFINFHLHYHKDAQLNKATNNCCEIYVLGEVFDGKQPQKSNKEVVDSMRIVNSFQTFTKHISQFYGRYLAIYINQSKNEFFIINDACSQSQVFFDSTYENLATTVKLLSNFTDLVPHKNINATNYYKSEDFKKLKLFVNNSTHIENIKRLMPNYALDMVEKNTFRFFPTKRTKTKTVTEVAKLAAELLQGYIKAISYRYELYVPITAGYDSRLLFLASLNIPCTYFITRFEGMKDDHEDMVFAKKISKMYNKKLKIIDDPIYANEDFENSYSSSLDFPSFTTPDPVGNNAIVNGNISEIARNHFHHLIAINGKDLNFLHLYKKHPFVEMELQKWLDQSKKAFTRNGYHILDFFLWEQYMGILHSKTKSEVNQLNVNVFTPYNSRLLLESMLSTKRKYRFRDHNKLYDEIIKCFTDKKEMLNLPVNPHPIQDRHSFLRKIKLFKIYSNLRTKLRI